MVERVRITPNQMIVRRADGSEAFNTDNKYLRTDSGGNMRLNRQLSSMYYYTQNETVLTSQVNGACLANIQQTALINGGQVSLVFPEFYGNLAIVQSGFNNLSGAPQVNIAYVTNVYRNGINVGGVGSQFLFSPQAGGSAVIPGFGEITGFSPGDSITIGAIDQVGGAGAQNINPASSAVIAYGVFAYETGISSIPLSVTP